MITEIEYKRVNQLRAGYERKYTLLVRNLLNSQFRKVADSINVTNIGSDAVLSNVSEEPMRKLFVSLYQTVGVQFASQTYKHIKARDEDELIDRWYEEMKKYANTRAGARVTTITNATRDQIRSIIGGVVDQSVEQGLGSAETARLIQRAVENQGEFINNWRALRIARTEVMTASNAGSLVGARELEVPMDKIWIATLDDRVRDTHAAMNNVAVDLNEDFKLPDGSQMDGPGDSRGGPENVINCRCTLAYKVKRGGVSEPTQGEGVVINEPEIPVSPERVVREEFITAGTREEAEEFAKQFTSKGQVSYRGVDVNMANEINRTLAELKMNPEFKPFTYIKAKPFRTEAFAQTSVLGELEINTKVMGSIEKMNAYHQNAVKAEEWLRKNLDKVTDPRKAREVKRLLSYPRQNIWARPDVADVRSIINHEYGHRIDFAILIKDKEIRDIIKASRDIYVNNISSYASKDMFEYVAESFSAYKNGMGNIIDPRLLKYFKEKGF